MPIFRNSTPSTASIQKPRNTAYPLLGLLLIISGFGAQAETKNLTFNEHIQPILSEYCYHCHGPDSGTRYPEDNPLRLDTEEGAFTPRENGKPVIIKGDPEASLLVKLIRSKDKGEVMPPPKSHKELDQKQIKLLEEWVAQGAEYQDHWSFLPVKRPSASQSTWAHSPIDHFVETKLQKAGLQPNQREEARRFHRRLSFDLTGLPPTPAESAAFSWDRLEEEIDRMLATPASAEHFARYWLDAARYADTHGIHIDNYRTIWPYRDWVVQAFHQNMPWDQFTIEQIAGDLLPEANLDQQVATGFNRCLPTTGEGGAIAEEYHAVYAQDRTTTTSAVWLGLTTGCAACHDHKFDPISTADNYSFNAFFRNTPMSALDGNKEDHPPSLFVPLPKDRPAFAEISRKIAAISKELDTRRNNAHPDFDQWLQGARVTEAAPIDSTLAIHLPLTEKEGPLRGQVDGLSREWKTSAKRIKSPYGFAPVISETSPIELGDLGSFSRSDSVTFGGFIRVEGRPTGAIVARMEAGKRHRGWDLYIQDGKPATHIIDSWPDAANKIVAPKRLKPKEWHHVMITFDGTISGHQAQAIYLDGKRVSAGPNPNTVGGSIEAATSLILGSRENGVSKLKNGKVALYDFRFYRRLLDPSEIKSIMTDGLIPKILALPADQRSKEQTEALYNYYINSIDPQSREIRKRLDPLNKENSRLRKRGSTSLVMKEKDEEPFAHILIRGEYANKGERVSPNTPSALPPMSEDTPRNRLGLAQWLVSKDNPLTARVTMNRLWYQLFGTGIVESVEDFGIMGMRPSHPRLLDWLAAEFMDSGWNYRHMVKKMVLSATYQQAATVTEEKLVNDPENRLLSRGPRYRLDAEQIRDLSLHSSGLLNPKVGGHPVKPYQPDGVWDAVAMPQSNTRNYVPDTGEALYRRSLYTFWKRTAPHPAMEILNAPTREVFCVRRELTNTPLQAFVTLNDPQFVESSRHLAQHAILEDPQTKNRVDFISMRLLARPLDPAEHQIIKTSLDHSLAIFQDNPEDAQKLISIGASKADASINISELAAWTLVASEIFNLDEALTK